LDAFGIESEVIGEIEYHWQHLINIRWQSVTDTVAYWTEVFLYGDAIRGNNYKKLAAFAQHILCSLCHYHTLIQKWNKHSAR